MTSIPIEEHLQFTNYLLPGIHHQHSHRVLTDLWLAMTYNILCSHGILCLKYFIKNISTILIEIIPKGWYKLYKAACGDVLA